MLRTFVDGWMNKEEEEEERYDYTYPKRYMTFLNLQLMLMN
jgi:hypothetical protein